MSEIPLVIAGPTGSGKSARALALAREVGGEVVNLDPFQALAGLPILTAQPEEAARALVPHHLYGVLPLDVALTAPEFAARVAAVVDEVMQRGRLPILVTGSGLYLRAFSHGFDAGLPPTPPELQQELAARSIAENLAELEALDPVEAGRIDRANPRRVERALALCRLLGEPVSAHRAASPDWSLPPTRALRGEWLDWPRAELIARIEARTAAMFAAGVEAEVADLEGQALGPTAAKVIGLPELRALGCGEISGAQAEESIAQQTRQYAKRQRTWFARECWLERIEV